MQEHCGKWTILQDSERNIVYHYLSWGWKKFISEHRGIFDFLSPNANIELFYYYRDPYMEDFGRENNR